MNKCSYVNLFDERMLLMRNADCNHNHNEIELIKEITATIPSNEKLNALSDFFKAFSDPNRLRIIQSLSKNELCVCDIADIAGMTQSAVSHQLRYLKNINILSCRRDGKSIIYSLKDSHILHIFGEGLIHISEEKEDTHNA